MGENIIRTNSKEGVVVVRWLCTKRSSQPIREGRLMVPTWPMCSSTIVWLIAADFESNLLMAAPWWLPAKRPFRLIRDHLLLYHQQPWPVLTITVHVPTPLAYAFCQCNIWAVRKTLSMVFHYFEICPVSSNEFWSYQILLTLSDNFGSFQILRDSLWSFSSLSNPFEFLPNF